MKKIILITFIASLLVGLNSFAYADIMTCPTLNGTVTQGQLIPDKKLPNLSWYLSLPVGVNKLTVSNLQWQENQVGSGPNSIELACSGTTSSGDSILIALQIYQGEPYTKCTALKNPPFFSEFDCEK